MDRLRVAELFAASPNTPAVAYVRLEAMGPVDRDLRGHGVLVYDVDGRLTAVVSLTRLTDGLEAGDSLLVATPEAAIGFGLSSDVSTISLAPDPRGGKVCLDAVDCVSYGSATTPGDHPHPYRPTDGGALTRRIDRGATTHLDAADDTDRSVDDFRPSVPTPLGSDGLEPRVPSVCGDGILHVIEGCDLGDNPDPSRCREDCTVPMCGDGVLDEIEACDDGNRVDGDACTNLCQPARCGDGVRAIESEICDVANPIVAWCVACAPARCGDGSVLYGVEACDPLGPGVMDCNGECTGPVGSACGDGVYTPGEACDDGGDTPTCDEDCSIVICGDGHANSAAGEVCDDGADNGAPGACDTRCDGPTAAVCGNGVREASEACDDGAANGAPARCGLGCTGPTPPQCGDGHVEADESCDLGGLAFDERAPCDLGCRPRSLGGRVHGACVAAPQPPTSSRDPMTSRLVEACAVAVWLRTRRRRISTRR